MKISEEILVEVGTLEAHITFAFDVRGFSPRKARQLLLQVRDIFSTFSQCAFGWQRQKNSSPET